MFFNIFGSRGLPREPQEAQEGSQEAPKTPTKNWSRRAVSGRNCLSPAISFWTSFGPHFEAHNSHFFQSFFNIFLVTFWQTFGTHFGAHFGTRSAEERPRWTQEDHQELQRVKNLHFQKPLKTHWFFKGFWLQRLLKKASRDPRWLPKDTQKIQDPKK